MPRDADDLDILRAAWKTFSTFSSAISAKKGLRSMPSPACRSRSLSSGSRSAPRRAGIVGGLAQKPVSTVMRDARRVPRRRPGVPSGRIKSMKQRISRKG